MTIPDVLIAGAGIIGLSSALELATHGLRVTVLERAEPMGEASTAAAGMLAAEDPHNPPALHPFAAWSLGLYAGFLAQVEQLSGLPVPLRTSTTLQAVPAGTPGILPPRELASFLPGIAPGHYRRFHEHSLDPRDLGLALPRACQAAGVTLRTGAAYSHHRDNGDIVELRTTKGELLTAAHFVDCRGAWTTLPHLAQTSPAITPRKGQMLTVTLPGGLTLPHVLRTPELYLVPRGDGRVLVGATVEDVGFDKQVHPEAIGTLHAQACALWPPLAAGRITDAWAGLRPATADALPILDSLGPRSWIAAGHHRNGILLAPGTAGLLRQLLLGQPAGVDPAPFRVARFAPAHDKQLTATL